MYSKERISNLEKKASITITQFSRNIKTFKNLKVWFALTYLKIP